MSTRSALAPDSCPGTGLDRLGLIFNEQVIAFAVFDASFAPAFFDVVQASFAIDFLNDLRTETFPGYADYQKTVANRRHDLDST